MQFTKTVEEIADYVQLKYNSDIARMIRDVECPVFKFPQQPLAQIVTDANGNPIQERLIKMEMYTRKMTTNLSISRGQSSKKKKKECSLSFLNNAHHH